MNSGTRIVMFFLAGLILLGAVAKPKVKTRPADEEPTATIHNMGNTGWRVAAPMGFELVDVRDKSGGFRVSGWIYWSKRVKIPGDKKEPTGMISIQANYSNGDTARQAYRRNCGAGPEYKVIEGRHYGRPTFSSRCHNHLDAYQVDLPEATIELVYIHGNPEMGSARDAGIKAFLEMQRTLSPIENTVESETAPKSVPLLR